MSIVLGGVAFELVGDAPPIDARTAAFLTSGATFDACDTLEHVTCRITTTSGLDFDPHDNSVDVRWSGDECSIRAGGTQTVLRRADARWEAWTELAPGESRTLQLLPSIVAALLERAGGLVLHASGIAIDAGAVLFLGPSQAGKSTASRLARGAAPFTWDRAAVTLASTRPTAWALPGGSGDSELDVPRPDNVLPLAGVLRVQQGTGAVEVEGCDPADAVMMLRESAMRSSSDKADELRALDSAAALTARVPVGIIRTVLGHDVSTPIEAWLREERRTP